MKKILDRYQDLLFILIAFVISWFPWYAGIAPEVMAAGPSLAAFIVVGIIGGRNGYRELFRRFGRWRAGLGYWILAIIGPAAIYLLGLGVYLALGGEPPPFIMIREELSMLPMYLLLVVLMPLNGPVGEEFGWRGYLLPRLQGRIGPLLASLVIGVVWGIWHLPSFFNSQGVIGAIRQDLGSIFIIIYTFGTIANSIFMTWLYNKTGKSALIAGILWHAAVNFWAPVLLSDSSLTAARDGTHLPTIASNLYLTVLGTQVALAIILVLMSKGKLGAEDQSGLG